MDQPKIERMLRLMQMMSGNVDYSIDELSERLGLSARSIYRYVDTFKSAGFVVEKLRGNVYKLGRMPKNSVNLQNLIYFSEEEACLVNRLISQLDAGNTLKSNLHRKLSAIYDSTNIADFVSDKGSAANVEALGEAIRARKKVILKNYHSASSHSSRDRTVEPFDFSPNYVDVWAFDLERDANRMFKISRIEWVRPLEEGWENEARHDKGKMDCFRMHGYSQTRVRLLLGLRAKSLLLEEYPLSQPYLSESPEGWVLDTGVCAMEGVGRFVAGLADEIRILEGDELRAYLRKYASAHLQSI